MTDLENIISILESKVEIGPFEDLARRVHEQNAMVDRADFSRLADQVAEKAGRDELDQAFNNLQNAKSDQERRLAVLETEFDTSMSQVQRNVDDLKN